LTIISTRLPI